MPIWLETVLRKDIPAKYQLAIDFGSLNDGDFGAFNAACGTSLPLYPQNVGAENLSVREHW